MAKDNNNVETMIRSEQENKETDKINKSTRPKLKI